MNIDFNDETFNSKSVAPINKGKAGIFKVTIKSIERNTDTPEKPKWIITYEDENGGTMLDFHNYLDPNHSNFKNQLRAQGITLKHLWEEVVGKINLPTFSNTTEMLDTVMNTLKIKGLNQSFYLAADYGAGDYHSTRLNRKRYVPFIEKIVEGQESKLFMTSGAYLEPVTPSDMSSILNSNSLIQKEDLDTKKSWLND